MTFLPQLLSGDKNYELASVPISLSLYRDLSESALVVNFTDPNNSVFKSHDHVSSA